MTVAAVWRSAFIERLKATGNVTLAATGAGVTRRRATGIRREVWYAGEVVGEESVYSDTLLIFLLKAHRPAKFRDNVKVEHSGGMEVTGDRKVTFEFVRPSEQLQDPPVRGRF